MRILSAVDGVWAVYAVTDATAASAGRRTSISFQRNASEPATASSAARTIHGQTTGRGSFTSVPETMPAVPAGTRQRPLRAYRRCSWNWPFGSFSQRRSPATILASTLGGALVIVAR